MWVVRSEIIGDIFFGKILKNTTIRKQHKLNQQTGVPLWQLPNSIAKRGPCWWDSCGYFATLLGLMKNWWWTQPPFLHIPGSLLVMVNTQAAVSYAQKDSDKGEQVCTLSSFASHLPALLLAAFLVFLYLSSPLSLCGISPTLMHRCSTLIPLPLRHTFMIQGSKGQPCPMLALSHRAAEGCTADVLS